jgi:hypothetical protein
MRRSFWLVVLGGLLTECIAVILAYRALSALLPCNWSGASMFGFHQNATCLQDRSTSLNRSLVVAILVVSIACASLIGGMLEIMRQILNLRWFRKSLGQDVTIPLQLKTYIPIMLMDRIIAKDSPLPFAFCYGLIRPRVVISLPLLYLLTPKQIEAVLTHEEEHATSRDPLRLFCAELAAHVLFFVPTLRELTYEARIICELRADKQAVRKCGKSTVVSSLRALLAASSPPPPHAAGMTTLGSLERRVTALQSDDRGRISITKGTAVLSVLFYLALCVLAVEAPHETKASINLPANLMPSIHSDVPRSQRGHDTSGR